MSSSTRNLVNRLKIDHAPEARPRSRVAWFAVAVVVLVAGGGLWWRWRPDAAGQARPITSGQARLVTDGGSAVVLEASGYVTPRRRATVSSKTTGKLAEILVEEGMQVEQGQVVARLDDSLVRAAVELAAARLAAVRRSLVEIEVGIEQAQLNLDRVRELAAQQVASRADLDAAEAGVRSLRARLDHGAEQVRVAEKQLAFDHRRLADTVIRAPFAGIVISQNAQPGEMISPVSAGGGFTRTGICTLVDLDSLEIVVDVSERLITRVSPEQSALATLDAYPDWKVPARVITTVPAADRAKATVRVRLALLEKDARILPDMGIKVVFLDAESRESEAKPAVVVAAAAIRHEGNERFVYVVAGDRVARRQVEVGRRIGRSVEVLTGLDPGERVVVEGPADLADGDRVVEREDEPGD
ncbi:MAG: efflux RND transporter periplasmic adaptor subunit [bacterium]|nr:efflux RND transporter periplasmic adaptor subunit [bacterium]